MPLNEVYTSQIGAERYQMELEKASLDRLNNNTGATFTFYNLFLQEWKQDTSECYYRVF